MRFLIFSNEFWGGRKFLNRRIDAASVEEAAEKLNAISIDGKGRLLYKEGSREIGLILIPQSDIKKAEKDFLHSVLMDKYCGADH